MTSSTFTVNNSLIHHKICIVYVPGKEQHIYHKHTFMINSTLRVNISLIHRNTFVLKILFKALNYHMLKGSIFETNAFLRWRYFWVLRRCVRFRQRGGM